MYTVRPTPAAERELRKCDPPMRRRIQAAIELLSANPTPPAATQLVGETNVWRARTGDYRILYEVIDHELIVLVLRLGHHKDIYRAP